MLANALEFDSGVIIPGIFDKTITVVNNNDSGAGSLRNAIATAAQDESTEYFNGSNGVLTVASKVPDILTEYFNGSNGVLTVAGSTFSEAGEGQDTLTGERYSEARPNFTIATGNGNDLFRSILGGIDIGDGDDYLIGGYSELRPIFANTPIPFPATNPSPAFTDAIDKLLDFNGFPGLSLRISGNNSSRIFIINADI